MGQDRREVLDFLKFELKFIEDGGYGRSPRTPWRAPRVFEDSLSCLNFNHSPELHPCTECLLMQFVPLERRGEIIPCRHIPITDKGETINYFYGYRTQRDLEEALSIWLRSEIIRIEAQRKTDAEIG